MPKSLRSWYDEQQRVIKSSGRKSNAIKLQAADISQPHNRQKQVKTTQGYDKITLVYYEACLNKTDARKRELQLKTGFGRGYLKKRIAEYIQGGIS